MDAKGFLSKEMDAIIYSGKPYKRWENIGYAIVPKENVKATIEFEVYPAWAIYPKKGKENYYQTQCEDRKNFTPRQYFFFEQYSAREESYKKAKEQIKSYGYDDVFVLYLLYKDKIEPHYSDWFSFLQMIRSLGT